MQSSAPLFPGVANVSCLTNTRLYQFVFIMESRLVKCPGCGASVSLAGAVCRYCAAPLRSDRVLPLEDLEKLRMVANAMEESLKSVENNSRTAGFSFIVLAAIGIASYFFYSWYFPAGWRAVVLTAVTAAVLFCTFGFVVDITKRRAWVRLYNDDLKIRIDNYLQSMNYSRYEFDHEADRVLPKGARLRAFLFKP